MVKYHKEASTIDLNIKFRNQQCGQMWTWKLIKKGT